jgi:hypothetical protein
MIQTTIKFDGTRMRVAAGSVIGISSASLFKAVQMKDLGNFAISTIRRRVARGIGSDDSAMAPLSAKHSAVKVHGKFVRQRVPYSRFKSNHGLQPIRDLVGTGEDGGHMLDNISVRLATEDMVRISISARKARKKAQANERRAPWFSFSDNDEKSIVEYAAQLFHSAVEVLRRDGWLKRNAA